MIFFLPFLIFIPGFALVRAERLISTVDSGHNWIPDVSITKVLRFGDERLCQVAPNDFVIVGRDVVDSISRTVRKKIVRTLARRSSFFQVEYSGTRSRTSARNAN